MKKLNKKGFTLIELLAVIAILGILLFLVTPNILNMFTNARSRGFQQEVQAVFRAAQTSYVNGAMVNGEATKAYCYDGKDGGTDTELSLSEGFENLKYKITFSEVKGKEGEITEIEILDSSNKFYYKATLTDGKLDADSITNAYTADKSITCPGA